MTGSISVDASRLALVARVYGGMSGPAIDAAMAATLPALAGRLALLSETLIKDATPVGKPAPPDAKTPPWVAQLQSRRGGLRDSTRAHGEIHPSRNGEVLRIVTRQYATTRSGISIAKIVREGRKAVTAKPGHALLIPNLGFRTHSKAVEGDDYVAKTRPELLRQALELERAYGMQLLHDLYDTARAG